MVFVYVILAIIAIGVTIKLIQEYWLFFLALALIIGGIKFLIWRKERAKAVAEEQKQAAEEQMRKEEMVRRAEDAQRLIEEKRKVFQDMLESLPREEISLDLTAEQPTRHSLENMPEWQYSNITKRTNVDKIRNFVVIDTETNGVKLQGGRIIELSAIRFEDFQPVMAWTSLINPGKPIPEAATNVNHITDEMVADAPMISQVSQSFVDFVEDLPVVGYNLEFDINFLYSRGVDIMQEKRKYYDALELSRKAFQGGPVNFKLQTVASWIGIVASDAHRSLSDCYTTGLVFKACIDELVK